MQGYFITGTDTEIGKTYVSCLLLNQLKKLGHSTAGLKPIASGCDATENGLVNEDALALQANSSVKLPYSLINRYRFAPAIAPHIAAAQSDISIEPALIVKDVKEAAKKVDRLVVEAVGGWCVPLGQNSDGTAFDVSNLAEALQLPVILVVGIKLGCINHARLTETSIRSSGLPFKGWIANHCCSDTAVAEDIVSTLQQTLEVPMLAEVGYGQLALPDHVVL